MADRPISEPSPVRVHRRGDETERVKKIARDEFESITPQLKREVKRGQVLLWIAGIGFAAAQFLARDTRRIDVVETKIDGIVRQLDELTKRIDRK